MSDKLCEKCKTAPAEFFINVIEIHGDERHNGDWCRPCTEKLLKAMGEVKPFE